ncbi:arginine repressor [Leptolyngbya sp. 7M]|uniref:arginine repressor n=1 Tax=Leptolyngbya sp. 7M TaxID=2812896 RepID=UPI001B8BC46B|nr:hypothetical protein [Leptolyngbya sp. 7M]QYO65579.1 hypothetical protein JVX88_01975 [Leptolyngbya sp. 7M]
MQKSKRQQYILKLVSTSSVSKQEAIVKMLISAGFSATQASVSRDLEELGIIKRNGRYVLNPRSTTEGSPFGPVSFAFAGPNLIVAKCSPGTASALAVKIDSSAIKEIVGTIAGDDTVFIATVDATEQKKAIRMLDREFSTNE